MAVDICQWMQHACERARARPTRNPRPKTYTHTIQHANRSWTTDERRTVLFLLGSAASAQTMRHTNTHERARRPSARQHINEHCQKHTQTHACTNARARCPPIYLSTVLKYLCEQYVGHHRVALHGSRNSIIFINICTRRAAAVASRARLSMYTCLESVHSARHINRNAPHTHTRRDSSVHN